MLFNDALNTNHSFMWLESPFHRICIKTQQTKRNRDEQYVHKRNSASGALPALENNKM